MIYSREFRVVAIRPCLRPISCMNPAFELLERVSQTSQGVVWRARHRGTGQIVAVKQYARAMPPRALLQVANAHVVPVIEMDEDALVMPWLEGTTVEACGRLDAASFHALVTDALDGLAALHDAGVLHLDLKPDNVLRTAAGFVILDLASARLAEGARADAHGSVHCMAPECFAGGAVDARTDLYALGCVFHQALSGGVAFAGELTPQVITAHLQHRVEPLPDAVPPALRAWVGRLMAREPGDRPSTAREARAGYDAIAHGAADA